MELLWRPDSEARQARVAVLAAAFNPITRAHLALLEAARPLFDELLCVIPRTYPHKNWEETTLEQRTWLLQQAARLFGFSVAISEGGLFRDIAEEAMVALDASEIGIVCGRDAAERMVGWDYGEQGALEQMLTRFRLVVAERSGPFHPPSHLAHRIETLVLPEPLDHVSSTEVRERMRQGGPWHHLVPAPLIPAIAHLYGAREYPSRACHNNSDDSR